MTRLSRVTMWSSHRGLSKTASSFQLHSPSPYLLKQMCPKPNASFQFEENDVRPDLQAFGSHDATKTGNERMTLDYFHTLINGVVPLPPMLRNVPLPMDSPTRPVHMPGEVTSIIITPPSPTPIEHHDPTPSTPSTDDSDDPSQTSPPYPSSLIQCKGRDKRPPPRAKRDRQAIYISQMTRGQRRRFRARFLRRERQHRLAFAAAGVDLFHLKSIRDGNISWPSPTQRVLTRLPDLQMLNYKDHQKRHILHRDGERDPYKNFQGEPV